MRLAARRRAGGRRGDAERSCETGRRNRKEECINSSWVCWTEIDRRRRSTRNIKKQSHKKAKLCPTQTRASFRDGAHRAARFFATSTSPHSRCPTSGPPGSATAPPTLSRAAWSWAAPACPTPRSTESSTAPVRPRSASPFFCVITPIRDARPAPARRRRASRRFPRARFARRSPADATTTRASCARSRPHAR